LTVESEGIAVTNTGAIVSLGPPPGGIMLAQPMGALNQNAAKTRVIKPEVINLFLMRNKLTFFANKRSQGIVNVL
jgi:hypothetical protein